MSGETLFERVEKRLDAIERRLDDIDLASENFGGRPILVIQHLSIEELEKLEDAGRTRQTRDLR